MQLSTASEATKQPVAEEATETTLETAQETPPAETPLTDALLEMDWPPGARKDAADLVYNMDFDKTEELLRILRGQPSKSGLDGEVQRAELILGLMDRQPVEERIPLLAVALAFYKVFKPVNHQLTAVGLRQGVIHDALEDVGGKLGEFIEAIARERCWVLETARRVNGYLADLPSDVHRRVALALLFDGDFTPYFSLPPDLELPPTDAAELNQIVSTLQTRINEFEIAKRLYRPTTLAAWLLDQLDELGPTEAAILLSHAFISAPMVRHEATLSLGRPVPEALVETLHRHAKGECPHCETSEEEQTLMRSLLKMIGISLEGEAKEGEPPQAPPVP